MLQFKHGVFSDVLEEDPGKKVKRVFIHRKNVTAFTNVYAQPK